MGTTSTLWFCLLTVSMKTREGSGLNQDGYPWENFKNKQGETIDRRKLLQTYALMCPVSKICGDTNYYGTELRTEPSETLKYKTCKECSCIDECLTMNSCCPDLPAAFMKHECIDTLLYKSPKLEEPAPNIEEVHVVRTNPEEDDPVDEFLTPSENILSLSNNWNLMISSCPQGATEEQFMYCNAGQTVPVSSNTSRFSYRNQHCAACNHDNSSLLKWEVTFICEETMENFKFGSRNFETAMENNKCVVKYDPQQIAHQDENPPPYPCNYDDYYMYKLDRCNVTGLWAEYDSDIEWACENLNLAYKWRYKNVFCYICNPSVVSTYSEIIYDRCNITGKWQKYDEFEEKGCNTFPGTSRLAPFKNIHCVRCNGFYRINKIDIVNDNEYGLSRIDETHVTISRPLPPVSIYFEIEGDDLLQKTRGLFKFIWPDFQSFAYDVKRQELKSFTDEKLLLYNAYFDACGLQKLCGNYSSTDAVADCAKCKCGSTCAAEDNCCIDLVTEEAPYACLKDPMLLTIENSSISFKPDEGASMTVIDKCLNHDNESLTAKCESDHFNRTDILQYVPVFQNGVYKNIFCLMCNNPNPKPVFKIQISCSNYLETAMSITLAHLFNIASKHCQLQVVPVGYTRYCGTTDSSVTDPDLFSSCNQTGLWLNYDESIAAGCEEDSVISFLPAFSYQTINGVIVHFKNYLCFLCNPLESETTVTRIYDSCPEDIWTNSDSERNTLCQETGLVQSWLPYKNVYCYICNRPAPKKQTPTKGKATPPDMATIMDAGLGTTYRMMFILTPEEWIDFYPQGHDPNAVCSTGFSYDYNRKTCRVVLCAADKVLIKDACVHTSQLIPTGSSAISLNLTLVEFMTPIYMPEVVSNKYLLVTLSDAFLSLSFLCNRLKALTEKDLEYEGFTVICTNCAIITPSACHVREGGNNLPVEPLISPWRTDSFFLNLEFAFYENVKTRPFLESLNHIFKTNIFFNELNIDMEFEISLLEENLKDFSSVRENGVPCETEILYPLPHEELLHSTTSGPFKSAIIDSCPQIQLANDEFFYNETSNTIVIHNGTKILNEGQFLLIDSSNVRVCQADYYIKPPQSSTGLTPFHRAYNIFSYIFTLISLLCLLVTFVTYCIFRSLRTVPGKNIMSLCFSLFVAQGSLQFSSFIFSYEVICVPFAILTHYSWLATFFAMNVCSFHMYRLFYNKMLASPATLRNLAHTKQYLVYTYSLPLVIVGLTVAIHLGVSDGEFSGYGKFVCSLSGIYATIFTFIVPAVVIFASNLVFFAMAFHAIRTSPRVACTKREKREFFIYLKLCALTGISWPLQIIDGLLPLTAFSFVAVFINALQGFYIFISYVCNERVLRLFHRLWTGKETSYMEEDVHGEKSDTFQTKSTNIATKTSHFLKGD